MNALKNFILSNKLLVSLTSSVTLCAFIIFSVIAVAVGNPSTDTPSDSSTGTTTHGQVADNNQSSESDSSTTQPIYTGESGSYGEETEPNGDEEETTTTQRVDPDTLPYLIKVNRIANCLTVYTKDGDGNFTKPFKAITVSCGKNLDDTPTGTYQTIEHYLWRKMNDASYGQYAYRIVGPILFHSVPYYSLAKNDLETEEFNKLGSAASLGCVRMTIADAKWLMDNCPIGTKVIIYDDASNPGPLGKPETIKIPLDSPYKGWDPTDPDPANPWHQFSASITHPSTKTVTVREGATIENVLSKFTAKDKCGNDISHRIVVEGNYNLEKAGMYTVTVSVTDVTGSRAEVEIRIVVTMRPTEAPSEDESPSQDESTSNTEPPTSDEPSTDESTSATEPSTGDEPSTDETTSSTEPSTDDESSSDETTSSSDEPSSSTNENNPSQEETTTPQAVG